MIPISLLGAGLLALVAGAALLRRLGPGLRIGRMLAATPIVSIARARALAESGLVRYVGVRGRIDSGAEFEDEHHRPLVYRRSRLQARGPSGWATIEDERQVVPFEVSEGIDTIAVDGEQLGEGLVVVNREAEGTAGEIPDRLPAGTAPSTPVRYRVELVSSVEHAIVLGVPAIARDGGPMLRPGLGRPLVLTTLEPAEAMRLLAVGRRDTTRLATLLMAGGVGLLAVGVLAGVVDVLL